MSTQLTAAQWAQYQQEGYLRLGQVADDEELAGLQREIDAIMMGTAQVDYDRLLMQLDSDTGKYEDAKPQSRGHKGATLDYRKIQDLEYVPAFLRYLQHPLFRDICRRVYGAQHPVACYRAMFMNKPAGKGTLLPWHQDRWRDLDRDPQITIYTALDPATRENGCVRILPGTHRELLNPDHPSGFLAPEQAAAVDDSAAIDLTLAPGEVALLHNWTLHSSDVNRSAVSRRAFSVCYMDAQTRRSDGQATQFPVVFGPGALQPEALPAPV